LVTPELAMAMSIARNVQSTRMKTNPSQFFMQSWKRFHDFDLRQEIFDWFNNKLSEWDWNINLTLDSSIRDRARNKNVSLDSSPVLPVVHGTDMSIAWKIVDGGFATLSTLDDGFYGKGIYFSTSAKYILPYYGAKKTPAVLVCLLIPGNVYPVTEQPTPNSKIKGYPLVSGYQSHYAITKKNGLPFTREDFVDQKAKKYDEVVIVQESQVVPIFLLKIGKDSIKRIFQEWERDIPMK